MSVVPLMKAPDIVSAFVVVAPLLLTSCKLGTYDDVATYDDVVANAAYDALKAYDAEVTLFTVIVDNVAPLLANNLTWSFADDVRLAPNVSEYDDDKAYDDVVALSANEAVPNNEPVMPFVTPNEPVIDIIPLLAILKKLELPLATWNVVAPTSTDAVTDPVDILDKFNPTILEADIFVNPLPLPWNDPLNEPDAVRFVNVLPLMLPAKFIVVLPAELNIYNVLLPTA